MNRHAGAGARWSMPASPTLLAFIRLALAIACAVAPLSVAKATSSIEGYCWPASVLPGEDVELFASTDAAFFSARVLHEGSTDEEVAQYAFVPGQEQATPDSAFAYGCGWQPSLTVHVSTDWPSGEYAVELIAAQAPTRYAVFTVRPSEPGHEATILVVLSMATWEAYNEWGGKSLYDYNSTDQQRSTFVSCCRPFTAYSGKGHFFRWELPFVRWFEAAGYRADYCLDLDVHADPSLQSAYELVAIVGHDEYWTKERRDAIEARRARGLNLAIFGGNTCWWQIRVNDTRDRITCYKSAALDPLNGVDDARVTTNWFSRPVLRPENSMTGVSWRNGGYVDSNGYFPASDGYGGYWVADPAHWAFTNTGLDSASIFGREATIVGYETDGALFDLQSPALAVTGTDGTPLDFHILATSPASQGHATMGILEAAHGLGSVFNAATTDWSQGLAQDPAVDQITRNVLNRLASTLPPDNHPPVAVDDTFQVISGGSQMLAPLRNDLDPDGDALHIARLLTEATTGEVSVADGDTTVSYRPMRPAGETDAFQYVVQDPAGASDTATVFVKIVPGVATLVHSFTARLGEAGVELRWELDSTDAMDIVLVVRDVGSAGWQRLELPATRLTATAASICDPLSGVPAGVEVKYALASTANATLITAPLTVRTTERVGEGLALSPCSPNPFTPSTRVRYTLGSWQHVTVEIFDARGRQIRELLNAPESPGNYEQSWDGRDETGEPVASGTYYCRVQAGSRWKSIPMRLVR